MPHAYTRARRASGSAVPPSVTTCGRPAASIWSIGSLLAVTPESGILCPRLSGRDPARPPPMVTRAEDKRLSRQPAPKSRMIM